MRAPASITAGCSVRQKNCRKASKVKHPSPSPTHVIIMIEKVCIHKRHRHIACPENTILPVFVQSRNPCTNKTNLQGGKKIGLITKFFNRPLARAALVGAAIITANLHNASELA